MIEGRLFVFFFFFFSHFLFSLNEKTVQIILTLLCQELPSPIVSKHDTCGHTRKKNTRDPALTYRLEKIMGGRA